MNNSILMIAIIAVGIGVISGALIVFLIALKRQQQVVDSLVSLDNLVGLAGTVEVPFDRTRKGKVRLTIKGSIVDFVALTDDTKALHKGDRVLVLEARGNKIWVVSEESLRGQ